MTGTKAMKLWTTLITAFLALFATLGFTTTATAATTPAQQATESCETATTLPAPLAAHWQLAYERSLPPTMKQRIRAEAHGSSPSCRHLPTNDTEHEADAHPGNVAAEP
ncbi:DUF6344 domain-containing protein [Streptomyces sp. MZ04]|uniref:DUF6344 domain-containing protein n=1 Tax=Streptomyces sp. MZ04 TaxID=2559236 RepID=UPI00107EA660|nr:DUF6344 domain-containing protein [Streptomyces sp. MZ04]TGB09025.1 hypothetical protein E2651_17295 [Streptomyces sp. MZ04]